MYRYLIPYEWILVLFSKDLIKLLLTTNRRVLKIKCHLQQRYRNHSFTLPQSTVSQGWIHIGPETSFHHLHPGKFYYFSSCDALVPYLFFPTSLFLPHINPLNLKFPSFFPLSSLSFRFIFYWIHIFIFPPLPRITLAVIRGIFKYKRTVPPEFKKPSWNLKEALIDEVSPTLKELYLLPANDPNASKKVHQGQRTLHVLLPKNVNKWFQ
jgi:hypothetical protein